MNNEVATPAAPASPRGTPESSSLTTRQQHSALLIVFLVVVIDLLGFAIVLPLLPRYGDEFLEPLLPGPSQAGRRGMILGLLMASFSAMQFVFLPLWGRASDRIGRRPILLVGLVGSVVFYTLFGLASGWASQGQQLLGMILLFAARIGAGVAGATLGTAQAVIADCTPPDRRSRGMALIGAAFGIGFTFGPLLGAGALWLWPDHRAPGFAAAGFSLLALVLGLVLMPETWRPGSRAGHRSWLNWGAVRTAFQTPTVGLLILTYFLTTFSFGNFETTVPFLTRDVLAYGDEQNLQMFSFIGLVLMIAQGGLYQMLARRGVSESAFMVTGGLLLVGGLAGLGGVLLFAGQVGAGGSGALLPSFMSVVSIAVTGFAFVNPSITSLISRRSDPAKQGEVLSVNQSVNALSRILAPAVGIWIYQLTPGHLLPYGLATCLLLVVIGLSLRIRYA
jgi:MFS family permease